MEFPSKSRRQLIGRESSSVVGSDNEDDTGSGSGFGVANVGGRTMLTLSMMSSRPLHRAASDADFADDIEG